MVRVDFFINGKPALMNVLRNLPFLFITFSLVSFSKISLFSKYLITSIISFISLFGSDITEASLVNFLKAYLFPYSQNFLLHN